MNETTTVLAGPPNSLSGVVPYRNTTADAVTISEVTIDDDDSSITLVVPVTETTVAPGQRHDIVLGLQLPPHTAPGAYPLGIIVADSKVEAVAQVAEAHEAGLSPGAIVVGNVPGATVTTSLVIANAGNVDVCIAEFGAVDLYPEDVARTTLVRLATARLLDDVAVDPLPEATETIEVMPGGGRQVVAPGDTRVIELAITLPKGLSQAVRWLAAVPISTRSLLIAVVPAGSPSDSTPTEPTRPTRPTTKQRSSNHADHRGHQTDTTSREDKED
jgi:hypothetical protein